MRLTRPLILASASPRRAELLEQLGLTFTVRPSHCDEPPPDAGSDLPTWAQRIALDKARATAATLPHDPALVLGADTVVVLPVDDPHAPRLHGAPVAMLGKPRDMTDARATLQRLAGRQHVVVSAFAVLAHPEGTYLTAVSQTDVRFRALTDWEIDDYITSGEPMDKAGSYGIQGRGAVLVDRIVGDYYTVVGLPLARLWEQLMPWMRRTT